MLNDYDAKRNPNLTIRATHCNYMNDRSEFLFGIDLCRKAICEYEEENSIPKEMSLGLYIDDPLDEMNRLKYLVASSSSDKMYAGYPYLFSLSRARDSLPMWGMYAKDGNGLALVFDEDKIKANFKGGDCMYCQNDETSKIKEQISKILTPSKYRMCYYMSHTKSFYNYKKIFASSNIDEIYRKIGPYIKHKSYEFEQEFRVLADCCIAKWEKYGASSDDNANSLSDECNNDILFREKDGMIIPYVKQGIPVNFLKEIIIGPTADFDRLKDAITVFLLNRDIKIVEITRSEVPYRG